ncbi:hypothetical protein GCM10027051_31230 [Niabella terrae]
MILFPKHDLPADKKGKEWILQFAKAIWSDWCTRSSVIFNGKLDQYLKIDSYVMGEQSTDGYRKQLVGDDKDCMDAKSWVNTDWSVRPIAAKLRDIGLSKTLARGYNYTCTPIDPVAKDEADNYFKDIETKLAMRDILSKLDPELAGNAALTRMPGEPLNLEELEMSKSYGFKTKMAMEAELAVQLILYKNDYDTARKESCENLFDYGVAGYKEWIDENGDVRIRSCQPKDIVMSFCRKPDFSDKTYVGEKVDIPLSQLAAKFSSEEMENIASNARAHNGSVTYSPDESRYNDWWDGIKVAVLDFEFFSWNDDTFQTRVDKRGNLVIRREVDFRGDTEGSLKFNGVEIPKFTTKKREVVYRGKWIIGTEYIYDFGLATDMKRGKRNRAATDLSYHFYAYQFKDMSAKGLMERVIPIIDEYHLTVYKIQNFKNRWIPYIIDVDLDSLENVALGNAGQEMTPREILNMVQQHFMLPNRRKDISGENINYKAVDIRPTGMAQEYQVLVNDLARLLAEMRDIIGLNEITDGSSPNPKLLNYVAQLGSEATNNALRPLMEADKKLGLMLARGVAQRMIIAVKRKNIEGLLPALGQESMKFISVSPDIALHDWGIMMQDQPTMEERNMLLQQISMKEANGMISPEDYITVMETQNLKQAWTILAYRVAKRQKEAKEHELQMMQMNGQVQQQSAMVAEQAKQQTLTKEYELKAQLEALKKQFDVQMLQMKMAGANQVQEKSNEGKIETAKITQQPNNFLQ